jgi:hypothetical protein
MEEKISKLKIIKLAELISSTWQDYKSNWQKFGTLLIIPLALSFVINAFLYTAELYSTVIPWQAWIAIGIVTAVLAIFFMFLYYVAYISQFILLKDLTQEVTFSNLKDWIKKSLPYFWTIVAVSIVYTLFSLVGFILLVIPGIVIMVYYCFAIYFVIFEDNKFEGSLGRSRDLVKGYWWAVFGRFVVGLLLIYAFYFIIGGLLALIYWLISRFTGIIIDKNLSRLIYSFLSIFISLAVGPLSIIYTYNIFKSLKEIKQ